MLRPFVALMCVLLAVVVATAAQGPEEQQFAALQCAKDCDEQRVECYRRAIMYCIVETGLVLDPMLRQRLADDPLVPRRIMRDFTQGDYTDPQKRCLRNAKMVCDAKHRRCLQACSP